MTDRSESAETLDGWLRVPDAIQEAIEVLTEDALDLTGGTNGWSIRENVHHLVEANLVASNIVVAALAQSGCTYDWSWMMPNASWMKRIGYDTAPVGPALETLKVLCRHISGLISVSPDASRRQVKLRDAPGAKLRTMTVDDVLRQEVEHAEEHLRDVAETRRKHAL